ncbi:MAG: CoA transferase [Chloroflexi bacterium]|nr:CoA transferase [Chloroflexota bacterium]
MKPLPFSNIRVADFSWVYAGPLCTQWLAELGAEVIKVESNHHTDASRRLAPHHGGVFGLNRSAQFNSLNCSKKSITINMSKPRGRELAKELIKNSDVVVENFAAGVMERLGLGYETLKELKPDIVMLSLSGLGKTGPERSYVAWGPVLTGFTGLTSLTGFPDGRLWGVGGTWVDHLCAMTAAFCLSAALHHRRRTGQGQYIDVSMLENTVAQLGEATMDFSLNGRVRGPLGNWDDIQAPHNCYPCREDDTWVVLAVADDREWRALCQVMGDPPWTKEERFADSYRRWQNREALDQLMATWTRQHTPQEVTELLQKAGVAAGPSHNVPGLVEDPHLNQRGFFVEVVHPEVGPQRMAGLPWKLSACPEPNYQPPPLLGQDNYQVFCQLLGLPETEFAQLVADEVIF